MQKTYETYKDSGIEWIGNVPSHWEVFPMKYKVNLYNGNSIKDDEKPLYEDDSDAIPYIATKDVNVDNHSIDYENGMYVKNLDHSFVRAPKGSSLMCIEGGSAGRKIGITNQEVAFINKLCCFTTKDISILDNLYLYFYLQSSTFKNKFTSHLSGLIGGVSISEMKNFEMICPPLFEQQAIAEYLDKNCSKIDALIAKLEQQVTDLCTMKKAEISRVVTKGLNPDAPLKDSGIEWMGNVPNHWNVQPLKRALLDKMMYGANESAESDNKEYPRYIRITDIAESGELKEETFKSLPPDKAQGYMLKKGDVLFARSGATVGKTFLYNLDEPACFAGYLIKAECDKELLSPAYLMYYTKSNGYDNWKNSVFAQATIQNIGADKYSLLPITLPSISEQQEIVKYLDTYCTKVDATVKELQYQIADLKLYKQSIISEAVTGKIKVID